MQDSSQALHIAVSLVSSLDRDLVEIIVLSLRVSLSATLISCVIGLPIAALLATTRFRGRGLVLVIVNAMMGLPPVVVGLIVYLNVSSSGPLGWLQLLYTPAAMIIAQTILVTPIVVALSRQVLEDLHEEYSENFRSLSVGPFHAVIALIQDARFSLLTICLAGFGRAIAEVGAVMIVGGNINHLTRVMTTAIALETSRGDLALALALGFILLVIALSVNALVMMLRSISTTQSYA